MNQSSLTPTRKMQAVGIAGSVATAVLFLATMFEIDLPEQSVDQVAVGVSAAVTLITFLAGYFKKSKKVKK